MSAAPPADWLRPDWPAPPGVHALCTTRASGVSLPPCDSFNLGLHVGDDPAAVHTNRARLAAACGARPVFLRQVHGAGVCTVGPETPDGTEADGCVTTAAEVACTVMVADCLPVLLADRGGRGVAAAHAGWRGLAAGVLERTAAGLRAAIAEADRAAAGAIPGPAAIELIAWLGPCIGPRAFEVGDDVRDAFVRREPQAGAAFRPGARAGAWWCDLPRLARQRLAAAGIAAVHGNDGSDAWCTVHDASRFFSHRRDARPLGATGRMAACVWRA